jgi:hypothetical protein
MGPNFDANQKSLCTFIKFKPLEWTIFFFFKHFFLSNVHHSFNKIGEDLNIDNLKNRKIEINDLFNFYIAFKCMLLAFKI